MTKLFSSPYLRAVDTIKDFAEQYCLPIELVDDFRERKIDDCWIEDFNGFVKKQWENFNYKLNNGESIKETQDRNINALNHILNHYDNEVIVIGTHGTALSTIVNYYNKSFGYQEFCRIRNYMPHVIYFEFEKQKLIKVEEFSL